MLRLTPPEHRLIREVSTFDACYGGSEGNVLTCLSSLGNDARMFIAVPDNSLGEGVVRSLQASGVNCDLVIRKGDRLGMYFLEEGFGGRGANVIYARKDSEVSKLSPEDVGEGKLIDMDKIFEGCDLFHISGISFALTPQCRELCFMLLKEAKARGVLISFDFNYRSKLWTIEQAAPVYREILKYVDIIFASQRDLDSFIFEEGGERDIFKLYSPKYLVLRERDLEVNGLQQIRTQIWENIDGKYLCHEGKVVSYPVLERIGSGDAFSAGVLDGLLNGEAPYTALTMGIACYVMKHTVRGDVLAYSKKQIESFAANIGKDVSR